MVDTIIQLRSELTGLRHEQEQVEAELHEASETKDQHFRVLEKQLQGLIDQITDIEFDLDSCGGGL